jgi:hypothetical protein
MPDEFLLMNIARAASCVRCRKLCSNTSSNIKTSWIYLTPRLL